MAILCLAWLWTVPAEIPADGRVAELLRQMGQEAQRQGQPDEAMVLYQRSLATDPTLTANHLHLAEAYLGKGSDSAATRHLEQYVQAHPDALVIQLHLGDLLFRQQRRAQARVQFERCIAQAQERDGPRWDCLIHCHTQLMEIAEAEEDEYGEHLHRGIGLFWLARKRVTLPDPEGDLSEEGLLCKAAAELTLAHLERPTEARPTWYLHEVWSRLGQRRPAQRSLRAAQAAAPFTYLTLAEKRSLALASHCQRLDQPIK